MCYAEAPGIGVLVIVLVELLGVGLLGVAVGVWLGGCFYGADVRLAATVTSDLFPGRTFQGRVYKIYPTIERATGTFRVEIVVENADLALRPGMFTRVALNLGQIEAVMVPALAVLKQVGSNERFVFVVENGVAIRKLVTIGRNIDDKQEILSGLMPGEILVVSGQHNLMDQRAVQIQN